MLNPVELADDIWSKIVGNLGTDIPKDANKSDSQWYNVSKAIAEAVVTHLLTKAELNIVVPPGLFGVTPTTGIAPAPTGPIPMAPVTINSANSVAKIL